MARLQILELPEAAGDDRPPFILVVDTPWVDYWQTIADKIGALAAIVVPETVDIPGNEVPVGPDGYPLKVRIEGDFEQFRQQVEKEALAAQGKVTRALRDTGPVAEQQADAIERVYQLHRPVAYGERTICAGCSAYDLASRSTGNSPVDHDQCGTIRALKGPNPR